MFPALAPLTRTTAVASPGQVAPLRPDKALPKRKMSLAASEQPPLGHLSTPTMVVAATEKSMVALSCPTMALPKPMAGGERQARRTQRVAGPLRHRRARRAVGQVPIPGHPPPGVEPELQAAGADGRSGPRTRRAIVGASARRARAVPAEPAGALVLVEAVVELR
eukprot:1847811-Rhodomonas_salina.1